MRFSMWWTQANPGDTQRLEQIGQSVECHAYQDERWPRSWRKAAVPPEVARHVCLVTVSPFQRRISEAQRPLFSRQQAHRPLETQYGRIRLERQAKCT